MANIVLARVKATALSGVFANNVLHLPGEQLYVDLDDLGIDSLDDSKSLEPGGDGDAIATAPIASVAPRAPNASAPQGAPPGTRQSGTGRFIMPASGDGNAASIEAVPDLLASELEPEAPVRRDSDITASEEDEDEAGDTDPAINALVRGNSKSQLLDIAADEEVSNVSEDNNKAEIASKIHAARSAK